MSGGSKIRIYGLISTVLTSAALSSTELVIQHTLPYAPAMPLQVCGTGSHSMRLSGTAGSRDNEVLWNTVSRRANTNQFVGAILLGNTQDVSSKELFENDPQELVGRIRTIGSSSEIPQDDDGRLPLRLIQHPAREPLN